MKHFYVIHHSATGTPVSEKLIRKKWKFYNIVIKSDGKVLHLKDSPNPRDIYAYSYDVCLVGNFEKHTIPKKQKDALWGILKRIRGYPIIGHKELKDFGIYNPIYSILPTQCPGKHLINFIKSMNKVVLIKNHTQDNLEDILLDVEDWFKDRDVSISFVDYATDPWAKVDVYAKEYASGGMKKNIPHRITFILGKLKEGNIMHGKSLPDILIHELQHGFFYDAGLGDIHDIKTEEYPRGLTGSFANKYNWNYYLSHTQDMKLIKQSQNAKTVYAVIDNKRYWILDPNTLSRGEDIWGTWGTIHIDDPSKYEYGGAIFISGTNDPESR